ncbi:MAG: hypothetical protein KDK54_18775 [Leptospiraceae bacterium]|nr:hypothetical protein [Leptospiraceae bacterium]
MFKLLFLLLIFFPLLAEETSIEKPANEKTIHTEIALRDGSILKGTLELSNSAIPFHTEHGDLQIKIQNLLELEMGIVNPEEKKNEIRDLLKTKDFESAILEKGSEILPILYELSSENNDPNLFSLISQLEEMSASEKPNSLYDKVVLSNDSIFYGRLDLKTWNLKTKFGTLAIDKNSIQGLRISVNDSEMEQKQRVFQLQANKHIPIQTAPEPFLNTKILIRKGQSFRITSSGQITLASLSNLSFTPAGNLSQGNWNGIAFGAVAGKIGEKGEAFFIGSKYSGVAKQTGILYLCISETVYNAQNSGEFKVIVEK